MNEKHLDELLKKKSEKKTVFPKTEADFTAEFFCKIEQQEKERIIRFQLIFRVAAAAIFLLTAVAIFYLQSGSEQDTTPPLNSTAQTTASQVLSPTDSYAVIRNTLSVFGNDAAVVYINDELMTGDREREQAKNLVIVNLTEENGQQLTLQLACSDQDTIRLNSPQISGEIVASRCDSKTLVLDIDLNLNGKRLRLHMPAIRQEKDKYRGKSLS